MRVLVCTYLQAHFPGCDTALVTPQWWTGHVRTFTSRLLLTYACGKRGTPPLKSLQVGIGSLHRGKCN